nr:hypothetical protein [Tanacetum cinerariifolium]
MDQNIDSSSFDQIQTPQYPIIHPSSQEMSEEVFQAKGNLMKSIQTFLEKFNRIPFGEMPKILLQAWEKKFAIQHAQSEDTNEMFQNLLEDLQIINEKLAEYINSPSWNRPTFFSNNEEHYVQYKEYLENSSNEIAASNFNQEKEGPPQDSNIRQLIREECRIKVYREQKKNMEDTMLELIEVCRQKEFHCMYNDVDDLIESDLNSKLLSINLESQRLDNKKQEVKNISPVHAIIPILPIEEPEYFLSMRYEHLSTILETESGEVIKSSAKNLLQIPKEYEVTFDNESECDVPVKNESFSVFTTFSNPIFDDNDDFTSSDDESFSDEDVPMEDFKLYSNPLFDDEEINSDKIDPHYFNAESDFVESLSNRDTLFNSSLKFDYLEEFSGEFMPTSINSRPRLMENFHANTIIETLPSSHLLVEDSDSQREEIDILPSRMICYLQDDLSFPCPPPEPPDVEFFFNLEPDLISIVMENIDELNEDECFDLGGKINVFANAEDDDYFLFIFVIRIFLPYFIYPEVSLLLISAESEDTIFDPGISV